MPNQRNRLINTEEKKKYPLIVEGLQTTVKTLYTFLLCLFVLSATFRFSKLRRKNPFKRSKRKTLKRSLLKNLPKVSHYNVLGVGPNASSGTIKRAYRKLARIWHPDKNKEEDKLKAQRRFIQIQEAFEVLSNPIERVRYDHLRALVEEASETSDSSASDYDYKHHSTRANRAGRNNMKQQAQQYSPGSHSSNSKDRQAGADHQDGIDTKVSLNDDVPSYFYRTRTFPSADQMKRCKSWDHLNSRMNSESAFPDSSGVPPPKVFRPNQRHHHQQQQRQPTGESMTFSSVNNNPAAASVKHAHFELNCSEIDAQYRRRKSSGGSSYTPPPRGRRPSFLFEEQDEDNFFNQHSQYQCNYTDKEESSSVRQTMFHDHDQSHQTNNYQIHGRCQFVASSKSKLAKKVDGDQQPNLFVNLEQMDQKLQASQMHRRHHRRQQSYNQQQRKQRTQFRDSDFDMDIDDNARGGFHQESGMNNIKVAAAGILQGCFRLEGSCIAHAHNWFMNSPIMTNPFILFWVYLTLLVVFCFAIIPACIFLACLAVFVSLTSATFHFIFDPIAAKAYVDEDS